MYLIFESDAYQQQLNNNGQPVKNNNDPPDKNFDELEISPEKQSVQPDEDFDETEIPPDQLNQHQLNQPEIDPTTGQPVKSIEDKYQAIQKYILYQKLRELQYKLEDPNFINQFKNIQEVNGFAKFLSHIVEFFNFFDYPNSLIIVTHLLDEFKKLK
jgi:hypothetical protein